MFSSKVILIMVFALFIASQAIAGVENDLTGAAQAGKTAFLLVYEPGISGIDQAKSNISKAKSRVGNAVTVELNRSNSAETAFINKYRLQSAPLPLILVFAGNGAITGGLPAYQASVDRLVAMVPTPKKAEVLKSLQSGHSVFITASRTGMSEKSEVLNICSMACGQMNGKSDFIEINIDDPEEIPFLNELKINRNSVEPVTVVLNTQGQLTERFNGSVEIGKLVQAANKRVSGGCCPSGSGETCGPTPPKKKGN